MPDEAHNEALKTLSLSGHHWNALRKMEKTLSGFEPLANLPGVGAKMITDLMALGLVEQGDNPRYYPHNYKVLYKLSVLGWAIFERGQYPQLRR